jgi:hypothetical protein
MPSHAIPQKPGDTLEDKYNFPFCLRLPTQTSPIAWGEHLEPSKPPSLNVVRPGSIVVAPWP